MKKLFLKLIGRNILFERFLLHWRSFNALLRVKRKFPSTSFGKHFVVINDKSLMLGVNVSFQDGITIHCGGMEWCDFKGGVEIGDNSVFSSGCTIWGCGALIRIGKNFDCGPGVKIFSSRTRYEAITKWPEKNVHHFADVSIGDNVVCFSNVVINPGVTIGDGAVIGANTIVLKDVEPYTVVAGNPARFLKMRGTLNSKGGK